MPIIVQAASELQRHHASIEGVIVENKTGGAMARFRGIQTLQKFAAAHALINNHFNLERHLIPRGTFRQSRSTALAEWQQLAA